MKEEQQPLHCLNHKGGGGGYKPFRVIIDNTTNNLIKEKQGKTLEVRQNNFSTLLVDILLRVTGNSHHEKTTQTESFPNVMPCQATERKK